MTVLAIKPEVDASDTASGKESRALPPSMVERMTLILDAFETPSTRLTLEQVAGATSLPRSTAHRILDQLVRLQWLAHSSFGYALGARALGLGGSSGGHGDVREAAAEVLHQLQVRTGMVVHLAVLDGAQVHYLDKVGGRFATVVPSRVGGRAPAHSTALGKAMLACLDAEEVDERITGSINRQTGRTICDLATLHHELNRIRNRHGLAFERGECFQDIACVAAAVRGPEGPVAAISLVGDAQTPLERVAPLVVDAARQVTRSLFPNLAPARPARPVRAVKSAQRPAATPEQSWSTEALDRMMSTQYGDWF